jgi:hypothetical protein
MNKVRKIYLAVLVFFYFIICIFYPCFIFFYTVFFSFYLVVEFFAKREKNKIIYGGRSFLIPPAEWIMNIVHIFYYGALSGKGITITFGYSDTFLQNTNSVSQIILHAPALYDYLRFFVDSKNSNITIFVNSIGFIEKIMWDYQIEKSDLEKNQILITSNKEYTDKKYIVFTDENVFTQMNQSSLYQFLSDFIKKAI